MPRQVAMYVEALPQIAREFGKKAMQDARRASVLALFRALLMLQKP